MSTVYTCIEYGELEPKPCIIATSSAVSLAECKSFNVEVLAQRLEIRASAAFAASKAVVWWAFREV